MELIIDENGKARDIEACSINIICESEKEAERLRKGLTTGMVQMMEWHPVKYKKPTRDDINFCRDKALDIPEFVYSGTLPEDQEDVLIITRYGSIEKDTFFIDNCGCCYFEEYCDENDVVAWMPLPKPYKEEGKNES